MNQVSSRCLITTTSNTIDVIDVDDFTSPLLVHSFPSPDASANALAFDERNERLYVGSYGKIHSLDMMDICLAINTNSSSVPSIVIANAGNPIWGLAYDSKEARLYSASDRSSFDRANIYTGVSTAILWTGIKYKYIYIISGVYK